MKRKSAIRRLKIISGQIEGLVRMLESEERCEAVFPQIKAIKNAFHSFSSEVTKEMMKECVPQLSDDQVEKMETIMNHFTKL